MFHQTMCASAGLQCSTQRPIPTRRLQRFLRIWAFGFGEGRGGGARRGARRQERRSNHCAQACTRARGHGGTQHGTHLALKHTVHEQPLSTNVIVTQETKDMTQ